LTILVYKARISRAYEYRIENDIKKKIKSFAELEMILLIEKGFLDELDLSVFTQNLMTNPQIKSKCHSIISPASKISLRIWWAGRDA
jgi:hypothetical protein